MVVEADELKNSTRLMIIVIMIIIDHHRPHCCRVNSH
jgi:hypothetical protein